MAFLRRKMKRPKPTPPEVSPAPRSSKKRKIFPVEVKLLAVDALHVGLTLGEVAKLIGVGC